MLAERQIALIALCIAALPGGMHVADVQAAPTTIDLGTDPAAEPLIRDARAALAAGDAEAAYRLLAAREAEFAGDPWFDYLLGVAALDTGRTSESIFSLRRSLSVAPEFSGARMELARAYFEAGNHALARRLFSRLLTEDPPADVREVINQYIVAIDARPAAPPSILRPYGEFAAGYDSNANGSTDDQQFLGFMLSPDNVETSSPFFEFAGGVDWIVPRSTRFAWYAGARASHRSNPDASFVDATTINGQGGLSFRRGDYFGRAGIDAWNAWRDGESNQSWAGAGLLLGRRLSANWDLTFDFRGGALRHDESIEVLDVNRYFYTLAAVYRYAADGSVRIEAIGGQDSEQVSGSPYGNSKAGGRLSLDTRLGGAWIRGSIGVLSSDFDGLFFGTPREDTQASGVLEVEFRDAFVDGLSIIPTVRYIDNDSDVDLYEYNRAEFGIRLRWAPR